MTLTDYPILGAADLTLDQFRRILIDAGSPAAIEAQAMYVNLLAEGVRPAVFLGFFKQESQFGTQGIVVTYQTHNPGNVRTPEIPSIFITSVDTPRGKFAKYPDWQAGTTDWAFRMTGPKYAGAGLTTVRQVLPVYAPTGDADNNPTAYIDAVLSSIAEWTKGAPPVALQKPPVDTSHPSPNHGYPGDYRPEAICWHITAGSGASALSWLTNPASNASANYLIMEDGKTYELVNPEVGQQGAAWANGQVDHPNMANPLVASWVNGGINPNRRTVSIEHGGQPHVPLTAAQVAASERLTAWLCQRFGIAPDRTHIIPHAYIDSINRPNCPGFSEVEWQSRVAAIAALVGGSPPAPPPATDAIVARSYINTLGQPETIITWGGQATEILGTDYKDVGIRVKNAAGQIFHRSILDGQGQLYVEE
jgi:N-acetyl-anhydromuramyl-L-alanine amidase AmpD